MKFTAKEKCDCKQWDGSQPALNPLTDKTVCWRCKNTGEIWKGEGMSCEHKRIRHMTWPDNGTSELCVDCLLTRHSWEQGITDWQDHKYMSPADWYKEAMELQMQMDKI